MIRTASFCLMVLAAALVAGCALHSRDQGITATPPPESAPPDIYLAYQTETASTLR